MFMPLGIAVMLFIKQTGQSEVASIPFILLSTSKEMVQRVAQLL